jgi:tetratricopeptide (TPR) repeat protein
MTQDGTSGARVFGSIDWRSHAGVLCAIAIASSIAAGPLRAQPVDNDYYASKGTPLLRTVEAYHLGPAEEKLKLRQYSQARSELAFILRYFPNHPRALLLLGQLCTEWKAPECLPDFVFEKAIHVRPDEPSVYIVHGIYLHRTKRYKEAIASYERGLALDPDSMNGHYNLALSLLETRQYALANEHAQRAYALGAPLPGLRQRLQKAGHWKPLEGAGAPSKAAAPPPAPQQTN